jgi:hypothetical protein
MIVLVLIIYLEDETADGCRNCVVTQFVTLLAVVIGMTSLHLMLFFIS